MVLHAGVTGAGAVVKRPVAANRARRRASGTLVRCRAYIWTKEELAHLNGLPDHPKDRHPNLTDLDVIEPKLSALLCGHLKSVAKSDGNLVMRAKILHDPNDSPPTSPQQSPVQNHLSPVPGITTRLIDLGI